MIVSVPAGLVLSAAVVWQSSTAAFTASTSNPNNTFAAGSVALTDDDSGSAMFTVSGMKPGSTGSKCILVTYNGTSPAAVKLFVASGDYTGTGLGTYLNLVIEEGSGGTFSSCASFSATATDYTGTLSAFASASTNSATGVGSFAPTAAAQTKAYRFTYTLADNNAAQGLNSTVKFTGEATGT